MGCPARQLPVKKSILAPKKFFTDLVKFHYGLSSEAIARKKIYPRTKKNFLGLSQISLWAIAHKKSILALSFEILAPKKFFTDLVKFHYGLSSEAIARKKIYPRTKKFFYGLSQISLWAVQRANCP
jgi:hypothetical protein